MDFEGEGLNNGTTTFELEEAPTLTSRASIKAAILTVMAGISLLANTTTLCSIAINRRNNKGSTSTLYTLLFQLAVADLLVSIWCLSGEAAWTYTVEWKGGEILCKIFKFSQVFSLYLSTSTMILIGFDRLLAICRPINRRSCFRPIGGAWLVSALLASPQLAVFRVLEGPFRQPFQQCVTYGFYTEEWQEQLYSIFSLLTMFVLPLIALIACYACIFRSIAKEKGRVQLSRAPLQSSIRYQSSGGSLRHRLPRDRDQHPEQPDEQQHIQTTTLYGNVLTLDPRRDIFHKAKKKSLRISIIIVSAFVVCWAPYYFMMITFIFLKPDEKLGEDLQSAIFFFGMSNSLINPLIYGAFHLYPSGRRKRDRGSFSIRSTDSFRGSRMANGGRRRQLASAAHQQSPIAVDLHLPERTPSRTRCSLLLRDGAGESGSINNSNVRRSRRSCVADRRFHSPSTATCL